MRNRLYKRKWARIRQSKYKNENNKMCEGTHSPLYIVCYTARVRRAQTRAPSMDALRFLIALLPTNQPTNQPRLYIPTFANLKMKKNIYSIPICLSLFIFFHSPLLLAGSTHFRRKAVSSRWSMLRKRAKTQGKLIFSSHLNQLLQHYPRCCLQRRHYSWN